MKQLFRIVLTLLALMMSAPVSAAVIGTYLQDYGRSQGRIDPQGADRLGGQFVRVQENRPVADLFYASFNFSNLAGAVIDSIALTLTYDRAGPARNSAEIWQVNILGSQPGNINSDYNGILFDSASPQTWTLSAATDSLTNDAFSAALSNMSLGFTFDEIGTQGTDNFRLYSAQLVVNGTAAVAVVPLPAPGFLLLGALGGLGLMRRFKSGRATA